jgi:hypothetical protein
MYGATTTVHPGLTADDIAGIRSMYGSRQHDAYDAAASNNSVGSATALGLSSGAANIRADLTSQADADYYKVIATSNSMTVSVDARGVSLLAPKVGVYDAGGNLLATISADYGKVATVTVSGLTAGQTYYLMADGATSDVFGMGAYRLDVKSGATSVTPTPSPTAPAAPANLTAAPAGTSQIDLLWQDQSGNEDGFRIERSSDGVNFTTVATTGANVSRYSATGLSAGTTYHFRVRAMNGAGASAASNVAQATTAAQPAPAPTPEPTPEPEPSPTPVSSGDRYESNDTFAESKYLGRLNNASQTGLTIHDAADVDFFSFKAGTNGTFGVSILSAQNSGGVGFQLYDAQQVMLADSAAGAMSVAMRKGQRYYLKIASPSGAASAYDLAITKLTANTRRAGGGAFLLAQPHGDSKLDMLADPEPAAHAPGGCGCPLCSGTVLNVGR